MPPKLSPSTFIGVQGNGIISFGSGQPDLPPPKQVFRILPHYRAFKYGLIQGQLDLRKALARQYPKSSPDSFVVTNGASEALDLTLRVLAKSGNLSKNKVLLPRPYYYTYPHLVRYAAMEPVYTDMIEGHIDFDDFEKKVGACKAVIINSPSNPAGRVESVKTLKKIEKLCADLGVYVLSDDVYKDIIYVSENYSMKGPSVVTIHSFSKTYSLCGLRVGYLRSSDPLLVNGTIEMKTRTSMNTNILAQAMAYEATKVPRTFVEKQVKIWRQRRDLIYAGLSDLGLDLWKPEGAFYVLPKIKNPRKFVSDMFYRHKVITYLGEWFGAPDRVRFSYALDVEKIEEGLKRVRKYMAHR